MLQFKGLSTLDAPESVCSREEGGLSSAGEQLQNHGASALPSVGGEYCLVPSRTSVEMVELQPSAKAREPRRTCAVPSCGGAIAGQGRGVLQLFSEPILGK